MIRVAVTLQIDAAIQRVWDELTDWQANSEWIPFTRVTVTKQTIGVGTEFIGVTRFGPIKLDDPMVVTEFQPPQDGKALAKVSKVGRTLNGTAGFTLTAQGSGQTTLYWWEEVSARPRLPRWVERLLVEPVGKAAFGYALRNFVRIAKAKLVT